MGGHAGIVRLSREQIGEWPVASYESLHKRLGISDKFQLTYAFQLPESDGGLIAIRVVGYSLPWIPENERLTELQLSDIQEPTATDRMEFHPGEIIHVGPGHEYTAGTVGK